MLYQECRLSRVLATVLCSERALALCIAALAAACTGRVQSTDPSQKVADEGDDSDGSGGSDVASGLADGAGAVPLATLTRDEYDRTVRDLLGDMTSPAR